MDQVEERETQIIKEFDYSNAVPEIEIISFLIQYCESYYNQLIKLCEEDEEKNVKLKSEYKNFQYKKVYNTGFEINIKEKGKSFTSMTFKNYNTFIECYNTGHLNNIDSLVINLNLSFKRGKEFSLIEHENIFKISIKPYDIVFTRKSNFADPNMEQIENIINEIMKKFRVQNTIFCNRQQNI